MLRLKSKMDYDGQGSKRKQRKELRTEVGRKRRELWLEEKVPAKETENRTARMAGDNLRKLA